jgi:ATP/maltotriose-dependent transcriptional regulator MalT
LDRKLTLVSAPAGFGKTTLAAEWLTVAILVHCAVNLLAILFTMLPMVLQ